MMKSLRLMYSAPYVCGILGVSVSGYYAWIDRKPSQRAQEDARLEIEIQAAHKKMRGTYGSERLQQELADHGIIIGVCRIRRLRKKLGIICKQKKRFKATTDSNHKLPVAPNVLEQRFKTEEPNKVWVSDITYIPTGEGWVYLAGHKDMCTGEIVGYAMGDCISEELLRKSLFKAVAVKRPGGGLIHHSDRGSQYCAYGYGKLLEQFGMQASMSGKGNCYDNAPMESFWGTLKNELVHHCRYESRQEAIQDITEYIEIFYNRQRKQKRLGYLSPAAYAQQFYGKRLAS